ncbi:hypothetical protein [Hoeflea ulvae]|uniref:Uncharacterized protein n=1 Tax=Hoeflea ulvae TaxID=2983764 RepID=A0ABT3YHI9_9HYPH|nr:hypothetical protein [Hoeflea ulvae]MCY0095264.1 hypothetical protein [Hoeflea ulvae]
MKEPIDPINVRQARQGRPVLLILVVSLALALVAAWVLWGAFSDVEDTTTLSMNTLTAPVAQLELIDGLTRA